MVTSVIPSRAQVNPVEQFERRLQQAEQQYLLRANPELTLEERMYLDYGGSITFSALLSDDSDQNTHTLRQTDAQIYAHLNIDNVHTFYTRFRFDYLDYNSGDSFDGNGDEYRYPLIDRWWYQFNLRRAIETTEGIRPDYNIKLKVGRQYVHWAAGLVLSEQLYAARLDFETGPWHLETLLGQTPSSSVVDFDPTRPRFDNDTDRRIAAVRLTYKALTNHQPYIYLLHQEDRNDHDPTTLAVGAPPVFYPTRFDYNTTYLGLGSEGILTPNVTYDAVFIYEYGDNFSNSSTPGGAPTAQTRDQVEAYAARLNLTYFIKDPADTKFEFETIIASGDDDRDVHTSNTFGGNQPNSTDQSFNGFGYAHTGLANPAGISNLMLFRLGVSTYPLAEDRALKRLRIGADLIMQYKFDSNAPIDEPTDNHQYIGSEADLFIDWRVTSDVSVNLRYGIFFPGAAIQTENDPRHFFYTGITYAF